MLHKDNYGINETLLISESKAFAQEAKKEFGVKAVTIEAVQGMQAKNVIF